MEATIERLAKEKSGGVVSLLQAWRQALARLGSTGLRPEQVARLAACVDTPRQASALAEVFSNSSGPAAAHVDCGELVRLAEQSHHPLEHWVAALLNFFAWMDARGRRTDLPCALGYIQCCDDAIGMGNYHAPLPDTVQSMLDEYGYEGR